MAWPSDVDQPEHARKVVEKLAETISLGPKPITLKTLNSNPERYVPFLAKCLQECQDVKDELEVLQAPTRSWALEILKALPEFQIFGKRKKSRLAALLCKTVVNGGNLEVQADCKIETTSFHSATPIQLYQQIRAFGL